MEDTIIFLTTGFYADRLGRLYPDQIQPDENSSSAGDALLTHASDWIEQSSRARSRQPDAPKL